ncbi:MAG: hypothetical protein F4Y11_07655 [Chloroflexi bacterium]|nr:hypothetical protein [Chloroflexota bacterium]
MLIEQGSARLIFGRRQTCLDFPARLHAELRDRRALIDLRHAGVDAERSERALNDLRLFLGPGPQRCRWIFVQQVDRRQSPAIGRRAVKRS